MESRGRTELLQEPPVSGALFAQLPGHSTRARGTRVRKPVLLVLHSRPHGLTHYECETKGALCRLPKALKINNFVLSCQRGIASRLLLTPHGYYKP